MRKPIRAAKCEYDMQRRQTSKKMYSFLEPLIPATDVSLIKNDGGPYLVGETS